MFDREKLWWMNSQYLAALDHQSLLPHLEPFLAQAGLADAAAADPARLEAAVNLHRPRARTLKELVEQIVPYFQDGSPTTRRPAPSSSRTLLCRSCLETLRDRYAALPDFDKDALEAALRALSEERGVKAGVLIHPTRMALSGGHRRPAAVRPDRADRPGPDPRAPRPLHRLPAAGPPAGRPQASAPQG